MKNILYIILLSVYIIFSAQVSNAQTKPAFLNYLNDQWVDSLMNELTTEQKVGQLFIAQAYSKESTTSQAVLSQVRNNEVGGVIFMQGTIPNQIKITNELQKNSNIPLLICIDGEWGPAFRLKNSPKYPYQMALGAMSNDSLIYEMGREVGKQFHRMGVHVNFAPVSDVNNNPNNPVINYRSFGEDPMRVAQKAWAYAQGMQDEKILAVAKHFPGHGDTSTDSHLGMPIINHSIEHLDSIELTPFRELSYAGIGGIMTGHIQIPALEPNKELPASLSYNIIQKKLKDEMGYEGMVFTDAMNMHGITKMHGTGRAAVLAIKAGNDMLEIVPSIPTAIKAVNQAVADGEITKEQIDYHCRRILALKKWLKLDENNYTEPKNAQAEINKKEYELTTRRLYEQSLTAVLNRDSIMPLMELDTLDVAVVSVGKGSPSYFQKMASRYIHTTNYSISKNASTTDVNSLIKRLEKHNLVIVGIHGLRLSPSKNYGSTPAMSQLLKGLYGKPHITAVFGNPYTLDKIDGIENSTGLIVSYQDNQLTQELTAQAIFGAINVSGRLPVRVNDYFMLREGVNLKKINRLKYSIPEEVQISSDYLEHAIDSIAYEGIHAAAYPGCQVLVAVDGKVILSKEYGKHTYDANSSPVEWDDLYDIASVTKISTVTPALMRLLDENKFNLDYPLSFYWPYFRNSNKEKMTSREILAHQARLPKWIPFWSRTVKDMGGNFNKVYSTTKSKKYSLEIAKDLYISTETRDHVYEIIKDSELRTKHKYAYSDLGFMIYPEVIEELTGDHFDSYLDNTFYKPLGADNICFNAHNTHPLNKIIPTERDKYFRKQQVQGYVHDESAALLGGISGNAGIFTNANDLAKLMQMYLQYGSYGNVQYIDSTTMVEFTSCQYPENDNRRALGFDKPFIHNGSTFEKSYPCPEASKLSFGHTGFTGTMVWMDPVKDVLFIFLSNRVYPERNGRLSEMNIRTAMLDAIYKSIDRGI